MDGDAVDEPTAQLILRARRGDHAAVEALFQQCLPALTRWAHGRIPPRARGMLDTCDLVQDTVLHMLARLDAFTPHHSGALNAYLRVAFQNRLRDEARRLGRRPIAVELPEEIPCPRASPLERLLNADGQRRCRQAFARLSPRDRNFVLARLDRRSVGDIARRFGLPSRDAARMAVHRALRRLARMVQSSKGTVSARRELNDSAMD